ncbi:MAG: uracil-DNA glycosylase [Myxococcales bacterium]|nr:uracil-DNA glycosylase [Myxococcales bacterium]
MGSTPPDLRDELSALTRAFREALARHQRAGAWAAPGGASARPVAGPSDAAAVGAGAVAGGEGEAGARDAAGAALDDAAVGGARRTLAAIRAELGDCQRCKLSATRTHLVFGVGPEPAPLLFVGEAPGADEDRLGDPFVGKAGELLDRMIEAMGWGRGDVYIANVLKCRPPGNRNPEPDEVAACRPFLDAQLEAVRPRVIVTLGRPAANVVLGRDAPISALRGRFHEHRGVPVMPTFHPAYLLREPARKRDTWSDLKQVIAELERLGIPSPRPPRT